MCFSSPKIPDPQLPLFPPPIEAPQFGQEATTRDAKNQKNRRLGTRRLQIPLGGINDPKTGLGIPER